MSDTTRLVDDARDGDRAALAALCARHSGRLLGFLRATMSAELARRVRPEDLLQETLIEAARKIDDFEPRGASGSFYRWLVAIARFKVMDAARAQRAKKRALEETLGTAMPAHQTSPSGHAMKRERAGRLREALQRLPKRQADAVRLRYLEGLSVAETAARLECSEGAVKALVARGMQALAEKLQRDDD